MLEKSASLEDAISHVDDANIDLLPAGDGETTPPEILDSVPWRKLSANRDDRVFAVNNEVWQTGQGVVAARGIIDDLGWLNAPIN